MEIEPDINHQIETKVIKGVKFEVYSKYELLDIKGNGAYALVCSAKDNSKGNLVAIKKVIFSELI